MDVKQRADSSEGQRADVFISHSRRDKDFARRLDDALKKRARKAWIDTEAILPTEDWLAKVYSGIERSDTFIFVISPDSVKSEDCQRELSHAVEHNKRLVPIMYREVDDEEVPEPLGVPDWIFFRKEDKFEDSFQILIKALDTDLDWVQEHTRLLIWAIEWENNERDNSLVLRGNGLRSAEKWVDREADKEPKLTSLQTEYLLASRNEATRRLRRALSIGAVVLVVVSILAVFAVNRAFIAEQQRKEAVDRQLLREASDLQESQPDASLLLNVEALRRAPDATKDEARFALMNNLDRPYHVARQLTGHSGPVWGVAFSPDGKLLATASDDKTVRLWDVATGKPHGKLLTGHTGAVWGVAFSPDGKLLASASNDDTVRLWDVATGKPHGKPLTGHTDWVLAVAFSPDGKLLASASNDDTVRLWDVTTGRPHGKPLTGHANDVKDVAFSPDGKLLASTSSDQTVRLWDVATGRPYGKPLTGHTGAVLGVAFSPDGKLLASAGADKTVRLWDVATGKPHGKPLTGHTHWVTGVAFSPDGKLLASSSSDQTVRLWDVGSGEQRGEPLTGHTDQVWGGAFSPVGKLLASSSADKTVRLWDLEDNALVADACTTANRNLSKGEWGRFVGPEFDYVRTCPNAPSWLGR